MSYSGTSIRMSPSTARVSIIARSLRVAVVVVGLAAFVGPPHGGYTYAAAVLQPVAGSVGDVASLPTAREIVERHIRAVGGQEALLRITSRTVRARYEIPSQRIRGQIEIFSARPNKRVLRVRYPDVGTSTTGFDGSVGWKEDPGAKPALIRGRQLAQLREESVFDIDLHDEQQFRSMETVGLTQFEGRPCYSVKLVTPSGREALEYFDTTTGRLAGSEVRRETDAGQVTVTYTISRYRDVDGVRIPDRIRISVSHVEHIVTVIDVEHGKVPPSIFELPGSLRGAATKPARAAPQTGSSTGT